MLLRSDRLARAGFAHAFPERDTPDSELLAALGVEQVARARQVHGARVAVAGEALGEADAIVARAPSEGGPLAVGVRVADCVPVLVGDARTGNVAAIHAGWRGVEAGVVGAALEALRGGSILAAIGPCIGPCCFEVGTDVADKLGFVVRAAGEKAFVDLRAAVRDQLRRAGVADGAIEDVPGCTKHEARFHSFRRDGANSGRMLAAIATFSRSSRGK